MRTMLTGLKPPKTGNKIELPEEAPYNTKRQGNASPWPKIKPLQRRKPLPSSSTTSGLWINYGNEEAPKPTRQSLILTFQLKEQLSKLLLQSIWYFSPSKLSPHLLASMSTFYVVFMLETALGETFGSIQAHPNQLNTAFQTLLARE